MLNDHRKALRRMLEISDKPEEKLTPELVMVIEAAEQYMAVTGGHRDFQWPIIAAMLASFQGRKTYVEEDEIKLKKEPVTAAAKAK